MIPENKHFTTSLRDQIEPQPMDERSCKEITDDVVKRAGITLIEE